MLSKPAPIIIYLLLQKSGFALQMNFYLIIKNTNAHLVYLFFFFSLHFLTQLAFLLLFFLVFFFFEYFCLKKFSVNAIIRKQPQKGVFIDLSEITYFVELLNGCFETVFGNLPKNLKDNIFFACLCFYDFRRIWNCVRNIKL